jgi:hypothetical protein
VYASRLLLLIKLAELGSNCKPNFAIHQFLFYASYFFASAKSAAAMAFSAFAGFVLAVKTARNAKVLFF